MKIMDDQPAVCQINTELFYIEYWTDNQLKLWKQAFAKGSSLLMRLVAS